MSKSTSRKIAEELGYEGFDRDTCFQPRFGGRYALFEKREGKWVRISHYAFYLKIARQMFQNIMIEATMVGKEMSLRRVRD